MSEIIGRQLEVGVGVEETRGIKASNSSWIKNITASVMEKAEHAQDESVRGVFEDMDGRRVVKKHIEGDIEMNLYANALGYLAYNLYGGVVSSLVTGTVYKHVFNLEQSSLAPSLTIFAKDGSVQQLAYKNCHVNTLELSAVVDDYAKLTASFMGEDSEDDTTSPSYSTDYDFIGRDISVKIADTEAGLASATAYCLKEVNITFDKGLILDYCLGSYTPSDIYVSKAGIEGSFQLNFQDETFKDLFLGNDAKYMEIKIEGETAITGSYKPTITLLLNKVMISNWERSGGKDELVVEDVEFKAFYNDTDKKASQLTIQNTIEEYEIQVSA